MSNKKVRCSRIEYLAIEDREVIKRSATFHTDNESKLVPHI